MNQKNTIRDEFLKRLKNPECPSIAVLSEELSIPKGTLYGWKTAEMRTRNIGMEKKQQKRSPLNKFKLIAESSELKSDELLQFCAKNGVSIEELSMWRDLALSAIDHTESGAVVSKKSYDFEIEKRDKELRRKNDALAEAAALLILQKKTSDIFQGLK